MEGSGPSLDELLRQSFLELDQTNPANDQVIDATGQHVFSKDWPVGQVNHSPVKKSRLTGSPWFWGLSSAVFLLGISSVFYFSNKSTKNQKQVISSAEIGQRSNSSLSIHSTPNTLNHEQETEVIPENEHFTQQNPKDKKIDARSVRLPENELIKESQFGVNSSLIDSSTQPAVSKPGVAAVEIIPERKKFFFENEEEKRNVVRLAREKLAAKITTEITLHYPLIPGAQGPYNDKSFQVPFYMWPSEVTVGEYTIFLLDLQLQGRETEYETARPHLDGAFGTLLSDRDKVFFQRYFSDKEYSDYPMVFISPEGAQLYCAWTQEVISTSTEASRSVVVRLPNKGEWERAASGGHPHMEYGTFSGLLKSGVLHHRFEANYKETQQNDFDFLLGQKSESVNSAKNSSHQTEKNTFTSKVGKYPANSYKLFDMAGNVSEMVTDRKGNIVVKGGNWNSSLEFLRIRDDDFNEFPLGIIPCPYIGFRPVININ